MQAPISDPPKRPRLNLGIESRMKWLNGQPTWLKARITIGLLMLLMYLASGDHPTGAITTFARFHPDLPRLLMQLIGVCGILILSRPEREYCTWLVLPLLIYIGGLFDFVRLSLLNSGSLSYSGPISNLGLFIIAWFAMQRGVDGR